jgi:hypothetical protein
MLKQCQGHVPHSLLLTDMMRLDNSRMLFFAIHDVEGHQINYIIQLSVRAKATARKRIELSYFKRNG